MDKEQFCQVTCEVSVSAPFCGLFSSSSSSPWSSSSLYSPAQCSAKERELRQKSKCAHCLPVPLLQRSPHSPSSLSFSPHPPHPYSLIVVHCSIPMPRSLPTDPIHWQCWLCFCFFCFPFKLSPLSLSLSLSLSFSLFLSRWPKQWPFSMVILSHLFSQLRRMCRY